MEENKPIQNEEELKPPNSEQDLNNASSDELIVHTKATTEAEPQLETSNLQPATDMEVHHHAHDPAAPHHKKNWKSYFWEFLMLFLAITLGFLVENQREHYIEHLRAKEFAKSLVKDLENDTSAINMQQKRGGIYITITDSLLRLSKKPLEGRNAAEFSFCTRFMYWTAPLLWNRTTFEQVKNSGSLRYFSNFQLLEKLMQYEAMVNGIEGEFSNHQTRGNMLLKLINEIIDPQLHHDLSKYQLLNLDTMSIATRESYFTMETASLESKRIAIGELLNMAIVQQRNLQFNNLRLQEAKELAMELINDLEKEYHLR
jgi:hypothetical protein